MNALSSNVCIQTKRDGFTESGVEPVTRAYGVQRWGYDWYVIDLESFAEVGITHKTKRQAVKHAKERQDWFFNQEVTP